MMFHVKLIFNFLLIFSFQRTFAQTMMLFKEAAIPKPKTVNSIVYNWDQSQFSINRYSALEKEFYYWVNYSRENPSQFYDSVIEPLVKVYPQLKGANLESLKRDLKQTSSLPLFTLNDTLQKMAQSHARDIVSHNASPSHNSTSGETFADRFKKTGLRKCGGENISYGAAGTDPVFMLALLYLDINVPDLGHRKALLNPNFIATGVSAALYKNGNIFLVEDFACPQN